MTEDLETAEPDDAPARGYLSAAGIPAGLLLWLGSKHVLNRVGDSEVYQREAPGTLSTLEAVQGAGMAIVFMSLMAILWGLRKLFWRRQA
jgi:hypothetical protein